MLDEKISIASEEYKIWLGQLTLEYDKNASVINLKAAYDFEACWNLIKDVALTSNAIYPWANEINDFIDIQFPKRGGSKYFYV